MHFASLLAMAFVSSLAWGQPVRALPDDFSDPRLDVVCHTSLARKEATVITIDPEAVQDEKSPSPENFQVNIWALKYEKGEWKILNGDPSSIHLLEKRSSSVTGGDQKRFDTWILKTHNKKNNPKYYDVFVLDRAVSREGLISIAGKLVSSPLWKTKSTKSDFECPVFQWE